MFTWCGPTTSQDHLIKTGSKLLSYFKERHPEDVIFVVKGEDIPAHRVLLAASSEYFCAMLDGDMKEGDSDRIPIEGDITPEAFRNILNFLYTGRLEKVQVVTLIELLHHADMYQIDDLKEYCIDKIEKYLSPGNVLHIMRVSRDTSSPRLEYKALDFILKHPRDQVISECLKSLPNDQDNKDIMKDILLHLFNNFPVPTKDSASSTTANDAANRAPARASFTFAPTGNNH